MRLHRARGAVAPALLLVSVIAVGLVPFSPLTRRFRRPTETVQSIGIGDHAGRVAVGADDEIGRLDRAINEMAGMIRAQVEALHRTDAALELRSVVGVGTEAAFELRARR